ncbi:MAG: hypothetical protein ABMB14_02585 [Myxococcota bacterium]
MVAALARIRLDEGAAAEALGLALASHAGLTPLGDLRHVADSGWIAGRAHLALGGVARAAARFEAAEAEWRQCGQLDARIAADLALARFAAGDPSAADALDGWDGPEVAMVRAALDGAPIPDPVPTNHEQRILAALIRRVVRDRDRGEPRAAR